jgi:tetratricopeptide (TPR) repeat protein
LPPWGYPPPRAKYWQGRNEELQKINQWLADETVNLIGIEGVGGFGKSSLAAKIYDESPGFVNRFWADVSRGLNFTELARQALMQFRDLSPQEIELTYPEIALTNALLNCLQDQRYLLVIDNLETLLHSETRQLHDPFYEEFFCRWLQCGGKSVVLVTTQEHPDLAEVKPHWLKLKGLQPTEGAQLLQRLGIQGTEAELSEFSVGVDGCPLTLNLVAGLLNAEEGENPPLSRLSEYGEPLQVRGLHRGEKLSTEAVLDASFNRLSPPFAGLLSAVSVYRLPFNATAAAAMMPEVEISEQDLRRLAKRSLLQEKRDQAGGWWFQLQPLVSFYAKGKLGDLREAHQRAIYYYLLLPENQPWQTKKDIIKYLEICHHWCELKNYNAAFETIWYCNNFLNLRGYNTLKVEIYGQFVQEWQPQDEDESWKLLASLSSLGNAYDSLGEYQQAIDYHQQHLTISREIGSRQWEAISLGNLGNPYRSLGQYHQAINYHQQSLTLSREIGSRQGEAISLGNLGNAYFSLGQYQQAIDYCQQSLAIEREIADRQGEAISLGNLGNAYFCLGQYQQAIDYQQQSLTLSREIGFRQGEAISLGNLGNAYQSLGQYQQAIDYHQQHLIISQEIGSRQGEAVSLGNLGNAYQSLGQYQQAINYHQQSLTLSRKIGSRQGEAVSLGNLGNVYQSLGQYHQAINYHQQSLTISREIGNCQGEADSLGNLGNVYQSLGQYHQAINYHQQSLTISREIGNCQGEANSLGNLGNVYQSLGQYHQAIDYHQESLTIKREIGSRKGEANSLGNLGNVYQSLGQYHQAIDYYQQSLTRSQEIGDRQGEAIALYNLGDTFLSMAKRKDAMVAFHNAFRIFYEIEVYHQAENARAKIQHLSKKHIVVKMFFIDQLNRMKTGLRKLWQIMRLKKSES